jgi:hypothetical protein
MNDRAGVAFRAARIEPVVAQAKASQQRGGDAEATVREGTGAAAKRARGPLHPPDQVRQHPAPCIRSEAP